ncbi:MAG: chemotaxis-specific protein-glutamate methyltransferase CheB [Rhodopila sp.]|jgi:two-component system chemotaxis response regulator CheB
MLTLLIADDSALMRKYLSEIFKAEGDFNVLVARNGIEALAMAKSSAPDVITLDVNMPEMDGITCLSRIMVECPKPVVMVSSLTGQGAEVTLQALALGAVDFIGKPDGTVSLHIDKISAALVAKVRAAAKAKLRQSQGLLERVKFGTRTAGGLLPSGMSKSMPGGPSKPIGPILGVVLIGVSTGGPSALDAIVPRLPGDFAWPIVIAQHMPQSFTGVFARRMDGISHLEVTEVAQPTPLRAGTVYVARGDADLLLGKRNGALTAIPTPGSAKHLWHPSVERLVASALEHVDPHRLIGILLTGMGDDGAAAMTELRSRGGRTIAESEETAVVWGMPGELVKRGGASLVLPLERIVAQMRLWVG